MKDAERLTGYERCARIPFWGRDWKFGKMTPVQMIEAGVIAGVTEHTRTDFGELAGETVYGFGADPGLESKQYNVHDEVVHLACLADVIASAIRPPGAAPWVPAPALPNWESECFIAPDGSHLRRIVYTTSWSDDKHYSLCYSYESLAAICHYNLPMKMVVVNLGQHRQGKYYSFWSHGLRHPANKKLRFRKKTDVVIPFKGSWIECWRSDWDDISTQEWLDAMQTDRVLEDLCIRVEIPVPKPEQRQRIIDLAQRKLEIMRNTTTLPDPNLSTCFWPTPCVWRVPCHALEPPAGVYGFVRIGEVGRR
jgi:hypothetical protein